MVLISERRLDQAVELPHFRWIRPTIGQNGDCDHRSVWHTVCFLSALSLFHAEQSPPQRPSGPYGPLGFGTEQRQLLVSSGAGQRKRRDTEIRGSSSCCGPSNWLSQGPATNGKCQLPSSDRRAEDKGLQLACFISLQQNRTHVSFCNTDFPSGEGAITCLFDCPGGRNRSFREIPVQF